MPKSQVNNKKDQNPILIIGENSKIAKKFISKHGDKFLIIGTYYKNKNLDKNIYQSYYLDLSSRDSIRNIINSFSNIRFSAVLIFSSVYDQDIEFDTEDSFDRIIEVLSINAYCIMPILKSLNFTNNSKIVIFGDSGLSQPRKDFSYYSISKSLLSSVNRIIAVELSPKTAVININLGPTLTGKLDNHSYYYHRGLIEVQEPVLGLVNLLSFILREPNLFMTATEINYDGGTYTNRTKTKNPHCK